MKHLTFGGSTIERTIECAAWSNLSKDLPNSGESEHANRGSLLHECMEQIYKNDRTPAELLEGKAAYKGYKLTQELIDEALTPAINAVETILDQYDITTLEIEPFVELIPDEAGGSIDMLGISEDGKTALILDYKFGFVGVDVEENPQLSFYALCAAVDPKTASLLSDVETLVLAIVQPKEDPSEDVTSTDTLPISYLDGFEDKVYAAIDKAKTGTPEMAASGRWCKYCPAKLECPIKTGAIAKAQRIPALMVEKLSDNLTLIPDIEDWIAAVKKLAREQLELGVNVKGFKLVNTQARRKWTDLEAVEKLARKKKLKMVDMYDHKFKSPAQFEKSIKGSKVAFKHFEDYISKVSSGTTLVHEADKRPSAIPQLALKALVDRL